MSILTNTPVWVWPLFIGLIVLGLRATRQRRSPVALIVLMPLLGGLSLRSLATLPTPTLVWSIWAAGIILGAIIGARLQSRWLIKREGAYVTLKGEWLTLVVLVTIFGSNFVFGALRAIAPALLSTPSLQAGLALALGLCAGSFLGRAVHVLRS